ncbi:MAG: hypothetical protein HYW24_03800 [Candidatus Aenigmarchaeota archaeon]|nr:hypothetical protein [Candidatus Aenigmarchaeota archaeon]
MGATLKKILFEISPIFFLSLLTILVANSTLVLAARLPTIGGDTNEWGTILNEYLLKEHTVNGTHKNITINGSSIAFEGSTIDGTLLNLTAANPTSNRTIILQDSSGIIPLATSSYALFFTTTGATSLILPTSGTLATLAGTETFSSKTLTLPTINGGTIDNATIGATTTSSGRFTTLEATSTLTITEGALTDNTIISSDIKNGTIVNSDISDTASIALSKLIAGSSGQIIVVNSSGVPNYVTLSEDATINSTGGLTIASSSITGPKLGANAVTTSKISDGTIQNSDISDTAAITYIKLNLTNSILSNDIYNGTIIGDDLASNIVISTTGNISTAGAGTITSAGLLTASNGFTLTTGTLILPANSINDTMVQDTITASNYLPLSGGALTGLLVINPSSTDPIVISPASQGSNAFYGIITSDDMTANRTWTFPDVSGTVVTTGDSGSVTNTMLAGSVALSKLASGSSAQIIVANGSGVPAYVTLSGDATIDNTGTLAIAADSVALTTDTTGNYVATITASSGISGSSSTEGGTPTISLGSLTADWSQLGAYDIVLYNASSELAILESSGDTYFGILDVGDLNANRTYTLPDASGTIVTTGDTGTVTNTMLAGSIAASKLIGTDIATVGTISSGTWQGTAIGVGYGGTGLASYTAGDIIYASAGTTLSKLGIGAANTILTSSGSAPQWTSLTDLITLGTHTTGNYVATITAGSGISGSSSTEGGTPTLSLGPLTADWLQLGANDIVLYNASSELAILESAGDTYFGILDVGDLNANRTYTLPDASGTVVTTGDTGSVTNTMLAGSIANSKLAAPSSYFTISLTHDGPETATLNPVFTFAMPFAATLTEVSSTARTIDTVTGDETYTIDVTENSTTVLSSATAITASNTPVTGTISDSIIADNAKMEVVLTLAGTTPQIDDLTVLLTFKVAHTT